MQVCPRASEEACVQVALSLAREGRVLVRRLRDGAGWVILDVPYFLHNVLGGILAAGLREDGGQVLSGQRVCASVVG